MGTLVKNKTQSPIEIEDFGCTLPPNVVYDLDDDYRESQEFINYVNSGDIVFVRSNNTELTVQESQQVALNQVLPEYETGYSKDQIDAMMSTQQAYTDSAISNLISTAPGTLDTLNEIAAALGDDPNFATTITNELAGKAPAVHAHNDLYYTENETDTLLSGKSDNGHVHDGRYYQKSEVDSALALKANVNHNHSGVYAPVNHNHDTLYYRKNQTYTQAEVTALLNALAATIPVFGQNATNEFDETVTTITQSNFFEKLTMPFTVTAANQGIYRFGWAWMWNLDSTKTDFNAEVGYRNTSTGVEDVFVKQFQEPKDARGTFGSTGSNQRYSFSGFQRRILTPGSYEMFVRFRPVSWGTEASMWNAGLEVWRTQ